MFYQNTKQMKKILFIIPLILLFSCSVQKRKYQKGFYVSNQKTKNHTKKENTRPLKNEIRSENLVTKPLVFSLEDKFQASLDNSIQLLKISKYPTFITEKEDSCDIIFLRNGDEVSAKVLEISPIEVKYKKCNLPDGPLYIVKKSDVFMVKYLNGTKEVFKTEVAPVNSSPEENGYKGPKKTNPWAIASLIFGILGIYPLVGIGSVLAIIFGSLALNQIKERPNKFEGEALAKAGKILGIVVLSILTLILIILIIALIMFM